MIIRFNIQYIYYVFGNILLIDVNWGANNIETQFILHSENGNTKSTCWMDFWYHFFFCSFFILWYRRDGGQISNGVEDKVKELRIIMVKNEIEENMFVTIIRFIFISFLYFRNYPKFHQQQQHNNCKLFSCYFHFHTIKINAGAGKIKKGNEEHNNK